MTGTRTRVLQDIQIRWSCVSSMADDICVSTVMITQEVETKKEIVQLEEAKETMEED